MTSEAETALASKAWPFVEAQKIVERIAKRPGDKGYVLFQTGYGPSGLPHIGTFGEVARTTMVRQAFSLLSDQPTRLFAFSDDMDGLRKVPDNVPNKEMLTEHLGRPLTAVPDPFGTHDSFGAHNNARLQVFLDEFGFDYEFISSTETYKSGRFDDTLLHLLRNYDAVMNIILPTLGPERQATYSPFLPVCPKTGRVLMVPVIERDEDAGTIVYQDEDGTRVETPVTGGLCKLQWKADWAMRWAALGVDYEMSGKDLIESVKLSSRICSVLGKKPPNSFTYELFLDKDMKKISKSLGNGVSIEEWLLYASPESLSLYMFQAPRKAKRLFFELIPRIVDEYLTHLGKFADLEDEKKYASPVWHIHAGEPPREDVPISFAMLLNLASVCNTEDAAVLWGFISRYVPGADAANHLILDRLAGYAIAYYRDFVRPSKNYRAPAEAETKALGELAAKLEELGQGASAEDIQFEVYEVGKAAGYENLREWFGALYETLLGQSQGPRMGSFIALYGVEETVSLINRALAGEDLGQQ